MSIKQALGNALAKIGRTGATSLGDNASDLDGWLHLYMVDTTAKAFFDRQAKEGLKRIDAIIEANEDAAKERKRIFATTVKTGIGSSGLLLQSEQYSLMYQTRAPSSTLDTDALRTKLKAEIGLSEKEVTLLFESCTSKRNPAQIYVVMETGELSPALED